MKTVERDQKYEELQMDLKISKIPPKYFAEPHLYALDLCKRNELRQKTEELTEYLDDIEVVLFAKSGKYPDKSVTILNDIAHL